MTLNVYMQMCRKSRVEAQCQPILQLMTACWKRHRRLADTGRNERPSLSRYKSTSTIESNKKSYRCLGKLITSVAMTTNASARQSAHECLGGDVSLVPCASSKERRPLHKRTPMTTKRRRRPAIAAERSGLLYRL